MSSYKKQPIPQEIRLTVFERDGYVCRYCGKKTRRPHADHCYPESKGGETTVENLVTACRSCNSRKGAKVGIWPNPKYLNDKFVEYNETVAQLKKSEQLQKNIASHFRKEMDYIKGSHKGAWAFPITYAFFPFGLASWIATVYTYFPEYYTDGIRDFLIFFVGLGIGMIVATFIYWRLTK